MARGRSISCVFTCISHMVERTNLRPQSVYVCTFECICFPVSLLLHYLSPPSLPLPSPRSLFPDFHFELLPFFS